MACTSPLTAWRAGWTESGKTKLVFSGKDRNEQDGQASGSLLIPCGQCIGCRLDKTRGWAIRIMNESQQYENNSFVTLTYHDGALPPDYSLQKTHYRNFMNLLRKHYVPKKPKEHEKIRFYMCGEYGPETLRPHYHACLFNWQPDDLVFFKEEDGIKTFTSDTLNWLWQFKGFTTIGHVDFDSAAYVAGYVTNKVTGKNSDAAYTRTDGTKEWKVQPPFANMSRKPGIGAAWYDKFKTDCWPKDFLTYKGQKMKPPRYYDKKLEEENIKLYEAVKAKRREAAKKVVITSYQLHSKQKINQSKFNLRSAKI